jgi:lipoprotein-releasing system permease protein
MSSGGWPYEAFVGWRYARARRGSVFLSFISWIAMAGIALGVIALVVVLSVMNGFQNELRGRILGLTAHVQVTAKEGEAALTDWPRVAERANKVPGVAAAAPYVQAQGMLSVEASVRGAQVRGIDPASEARVADLARFMLAGSLADLRAGEFGIVLGAELARGLQVRMGERVTLIAPQGLVTPAGIVPRLKQFRVVGVFEVGMFEFDGGLALVHMEDAQRLYRFGDAVTGVRLRLDDLFEARPIAAAVERAIAGVQATDWTRTHASFFRAVQVEKNMMFIILTLIVAVAAFNIVSSLVMTVNDKQSDIAILRTLGAAPRSIQRIFIVQGALIGVIGTIAGVVAGVALAANLDVVVPAIERLLNARLFDPSVYYISSLPSDVQRGDVITVGLVSLALALAATLYPSYRAAQIRPVEALRYD